MGEARLGPASKEAERASSAVGGLSGGLYLAERPARASKFKQAARPRKGSKAGCAARVTGEVTRIGQGQAPPKGRSPRRLRVETTFPGRQRIPSAETTSSIPPWPVGTRAAARPTP